MAAEVGLLTRNIRVEGASYSKLYREAFGARVLVSQTQDPADSNRLLRGQLRGRGPSLMRVDYIVCR